LHFRRWGETLSFAVVRRDSLDVVVSASILAALLARDLTTMLNELAAGETASAEAFPPGADCAMPRRILRLPRINTPRSAPSSPSHSSSGASFPRLVDLVRAKCANDIAARRRAALAIAQAVLDGAHDRAGGKFIPSLVDQQRRRDSLHRLRLRRPGRTPQAVASRRQCAR
jgi:hypothetical protein